MGVLGVLWDVPAWDEAVVAAQSSLLRLVGSETDDSDNAVTVGAAVSSETPPSRSGLIRNSSIP